MPIVEQVAANDDDVVVAIVDLTTAECCGDDDGADDDGDDNGVAAAVTPAAAVIADDEGWSTVSRRRGPRPSRRPPVFVQVRDMRNESRRERDERVVVVVVDNTQPDETNIGEDVIQERLRRTRFAARNLRMHD